MAHNAEATVNKTNDQTYTRLSPYRAPIQALAGTTTPSVKL